jgi:hypothetical protein
LGAGVRKNKRATTSRAVDAFRCTVKPMTRRTLLTATTAAPALLAQGISSPSRPNILFLMADQLRGDCLGADGNQVGIRAGWPTFVVSGPATHQPRQGDDQERCTPQGGVICVMRGRESCSSGSTRFPLAPEPGAGSPERDCGRNGRL